MGCTQSQPLEVAINNNDTTMVEAILASPQGPALVNRKKKGVTPLMKACGALVTLSFYTEMDNFQADDPLPGEGSIPTRDSVIVPPWQLLAESFQQRAASLPDNSDIVEKLLRHGARTDAVWSKYKLTPLHCAVLCKKEKLVQLLLQHDADINARTSDGDTPLILSTFLDFNSATELLIQSGAAINDASSKGVTAVHLAASCGNLDIVLKLIASGAKIDCQSNDGVTAIHHAAFSHHGGPVVEALLKHGADIEAKENSGITPLVLAVGIGNLNVVKTLLKHKAKTDILTSDGDSAIWLACANFSRSESRKEILHELIKHGADINLRHENDSTPLMMATMLDEEQGDCGAFELVQLLLKHGADVQAKTSFGATPLYYAVSCDTANVDIVKALLEHKADVNPAPTESGSTPLSVVCDDRKLDILQELIKHGVDLNTMREDGTTELMRACEAGPLELVQLLLEHGADVTVRDKEGWDALSWTFRKSYSRAIGKIRLFDIFDSTECFATYNPAERALAAGIVEELLKYNAPTNNKDYEHGYTALMRALWMQCVRAADVLLSSGRDLAIDAVGSDGRCALHWAARVVNFPEVMVNKFLTAGANPSLLPEGWELIKTPAGLRARAVTETAENTSNEAQGTNQSGNFVDKAARNMRIATAVNEYAGLFF